jgi:YHS domain-containing protein
VLYAQEPVSTGRFNNTAIGGHDTLAYHGLSQGDKAMKGAEQYIVEWKGAKWQFLSEEDSKKFAANPEKFTPAYNGHCANALSLGEGLIRTNGKHWAIFDDQLYLFYAKRGSKRWLEGDYKKYKEQADAAWQTILNGN